MSKKRSIYSKAFSPHKFNIMSILVKINPTTKKIEKLQFYDKENWKLTDICSSLLKKLEDLKHNKTTTPGLTDTDILLWQKLYNKIYTLAEYRTYYNAQSTLNKPKPFRFSKQIKKNNNLIFWEFSDTFYDTFKRIEALLGTPLIFCAHTNCALPKLYFEKVICMEDGKVTWQYFLKSQLDLMSVEIKGKRYHINCVVEIKTSNGQTTYVPSFLKSQYKICDACNTKWETKTQFKWSTFSDNYICLNCKTIEDNYKDPKFTPQTIFMSNYHGNRNGFKFQICKNGMETSIPIGMELETEFIPTKNGNRENIWKLYKALGEKNIIFERDGSLNEGGVECITNPMTMEFARSFWKPVKELLPTITQGIYSGIPGYTHYELTSWWGIHLTMSRQYWNNLELAKFCNFIYNNKNNIFITHIAQRNKNYGGETVAFTKHKGLKQFSIDFRYSKPGEKIINHSRTTSINLTKRKFIELRFFQATNNVNEILKNYDFVNATHEWIKNSLVSFTPNHIDFLTWLFDVTYPERRKKYKYLTHYLIQQSHLIRNTESNQVVDKPNPFLSLTNNYQHPKNIII